VTKLILIGALSLAHCATTFVHTRRVRFRLLAKKEHRNHSCQLVDGLLH
jgi:hypothetical protein